MGAKTERRKDYFNRLTSLVEKYSKILLVHADFVGSRQLAEIRLSLRGKAVLLMGKNTMIRRALSQLSQKQPQLQPLVEHVRLNMGFVFCNIDPVEVRSIILQNKLPAAAKEGAMATVDVVVPAGLTGLDSNQTSFFQALNIATRVSKSQVEILSDTKLFSAGERVSASAAALLQKLKLKPFSYGLIPTTVYDDGAIYEADVLDVTDEDILSKFKMHSQNIAALSRQVGMPTPASIPHCILEAFKSCAALCIESGSFNFPQMENLRKFVEDPSAFTVVAEATTAPAASTAPAAAAAVSESEEEEDMGFSLFD